MLSQFISTAPIIKGSDRWNEFSSNWFRDSGTLAVITYQKNIILFARDIPIDFIFAFVIYCVFQEPTLVSKKKPVTKNSPVVTVLKVTKQTFCPLEIICSIRVLTISYTTQSRQYKNINSMFDFVLKYFQFFTISTPLSLSVSPIVMDFITISIIVTKSSTPLFL